MDLTYEQKSVLTKLIDDYKDIDAYRRAPRRLNYMQFDYAAAHEFSLFMIEPNFDFEELERRTDDIISAMPAIKRIFAQPFIHLKEQNIILPVEAVRVVNNDTLNHVASHSELWTDVSPRGIKPGRLLTRTYEDNYGIYENKVFCNVVDDILAYARSSIRFLKELIYTNRTIEINLLDRVNHLNYFLALGKLHIGYSRSFESYYAIAERCLNRLQYIVNTISPRLKRPVYKNNKVRPANLKIRKTNILSMHKEYHQIYRLAKSFARHGVNPVREVTEKDIAELEKSYFFFCQALCVFSVGHFNFACDEKKIFDFSRTSLDFAFKGWTLKLKKQTAVVPIISIEVNKDRPYKVVLIPSVAADNDKIISTVKAKVKADEYIVCTPHEEHEKHAVFVDITSIESFRRLQQIVLRAMIYADEKRADCPFCSGKLTVSGEKSTAENLVYTCFSCRTEIGKAHCDHTDKDFFYTKIADYEPPQSEGDSWLARRKAEGKLYFRNITDIDEDGNTPVCPHCGKAHV